MYNVSAESDRQRTLLLSVRKTNRKTNSKTNWREQALRRRKVADCQIIGCVITSGLLILLAGLGMFLAAWFVLGKDDPFILIGPVFAGCGIVVLLLSVEVCVRRQKVIKLTEDLSSDDEGDGHYIDEGLVNYGFGNYSGDPAPAAIVTKSPKRSPIIVKPSADAEYKPSFDVEGRLRPEDRPQVNILAPTPDASEEILDVSMTQEHIELLLSPQGGRG
ncbi:uncharacterized protein LOC122368990 [Amphibalanus amphitrite]|uniref:uncharacterized protein LOC122368990 n=1 Tax=Amphibalanus amphitrite TaxID=1232801 RepID=UPI001C90008E|nr:uncharacterized protein LOC122368990 [Amphibalanus amphitrite]